MAEERRGLTSAEAASRLQTAGPNVIFTPDRVTFLDILWEEVREPMILLLLVVGVLYSLLGEPADAVTIFVVILLLTLAEVQNEFRAKRAIQRLSEVAAPKAPVFRDGSVARIDATDVVPGDLLVLSPGTRLAADATLGYTVGVTVDESSITGESMPAERMAGDKVFAGTVITSGDGVATVVATGTSTQLGQLATGLANVKPPKTPLQKAMKELSLRLVWVAVFFSVAIPVIGLLRGQSLKAMVLTGLSLSFATIPEEMPIIITMVLGLGSYRLSKRAFLVRRLAAAETMGAIDVIVTDKTGTLTESRMTLTGTAGAASDSDAIIAAVGAVSDIDATPLDSAIRDRATELDVPENPGRIVRKRDIGDGSKTKAVLREDGTLFVSGAPEEVFSRCVSVPDGVRERFDEDTSRGDRLIAVAMRQVPESDRQAPWVRLERGMRFSGLLSFSDPPRPEVPGAIADMQTAGVRTVMVTGDYVATAAAIARQVGIDDGGTAAPVVTGSQLDGMSDEELRQAVRSASVFARTTPQHKYRIVLALQSLGQRVAATGDGINDALAIKGADIGIAMGVRGTDVAKDAADAILADDDYATIANAVFEGRVFYDNLRKGVKYYLSVKVALVSVFLLPAVLGLPMPFSPVQIILLELFMDLAASAGFVAEPAETDVRTRRPEQMKTGILDAAQLRDLFLKGFFLFGAVIAAYWWAGASGLAEPAQRSLAFAAWMIGHVALAFVSRSDREPLPRIGLFSNRVVDVWAAATAAVLVAGLYVPAIGTNIDLVPLPPAYLAVLLVVEVAWMSLLEVRKAAARKRHLSTAAVPATGA